MKRIILILFFGFFGLAFMASGQVVHWTNVLPIDRFEDHCSRVTYEIFPPNTKADVLAYLDDKSDINDQIFLLGLDEAHYSASYSDEVFENNDCSYKFRRTYTVMWQQDDIVTINDFIETITVIIKNPDNVVPYFTASTFVWETGAYESDLPDEMSIYDLQMHWPEVHSSCNDNEQLSLIVTLTEGEDDGYEKEYTRLYSVTDECADVLIADLTEVITLQTELKVTGVLKSGSFDDHGTVTGAFSTLQELKKNGAHVRFSREESDLVVDVGELHDAPDIPNRKVITYRVSSSARDDVFATIDQYFIRKPTNGNMTEFEISHTDATLDGIDDGTLTIYRPLNDEGCITAPDDPNMWYVVSLHNNKNGRNRIYNYVNSDDIYFVDGLELGDYDLEIAPNCFACGFPDEPVYKTNFKIGAAKLSLSVTTGITLYSDHIYGEFISSVGIDYQDGQYHPLEERQEIYDGFLDEWEASEGKIYSIMKKEFDPYEFYNPHMGGNGAYENMMWHFDLYNREDIGHNLQKSIIGKDVTHTITYRLFKRNSDYSQGPLFDEKTKTLYKEDLFCSNDPNEIFGPAGYTDADSLCVRMINTTDDVAYTIMFENDPEFATAAAARVKVECPLSDKIDPTTFRLGNFGFNNMTFEVPEMASYYNQRLQLDSLGYWLDVTASIQVPENTAYWIFQTIDPETGVAPIDSLGFLPVNDTVSGCGEGFVTFTASLANNGMRGIQTGEIILENADIYFDENEVVPTNDYVNQFDGVAPVSSISCDTMGAALNGFLPIAFSASDDENGSGVKSIELYVNIDGNGYELYTHSYPDSIVNYPVNNGSSFGFYSRAIDNVGNTEAFKNYSEVSYIHGNAPYDLKLSNNIFAENDAVGPQVGMFTTFDDQTSDNFTYVLVNGSGSDDNALFRIESNKLCTNFDFRCYGTYQYSIRVRTTDLSGLFLDKTFTIYANETETPEPVQVYQYLCPGDSYYFNGTEIREAGVYYETIPSLYGCDSTICLRVAMNPEPVTTLVSDIACFGVDYEDNGFRISADSLATLTAGWTMNDDIDLYLDNYVDNAFGCSDTTRLTLTVRPAYDFVDEVMVCPDDLPYIYQNRVFERDTTAIFNYYTKQGCDSTFTLRMTLNPDYGTQSDDLSNWSWYSTYIDQSNGKGLKNLETALGRKGNLIKSKMSFVQYYPEQNIWYGNLGAIDNESMFMINTTAEVTAAITGCYALTCPITIRSGWNWIGYPCVHTNSVASAMSGLARTPQDGDVLKSKSAFATYYGAYDMWYGSLGVLNPGEGYMYMSNGDAENTLIYPSTTRDQGVPVALQETFWQADGHQFARNITFVGAIELDGSIVESDTLEVGVFCHGEQRGSGRAIYLDKLGEYRLFLTVHGEEGDELNFRLYDHEKNKERRIRSRQQVVFHDDDSYGKIDNPYLFVFNTDYDKLIEAEICDGQYYVENGFRAYRSGTYFNELPNDSIIRLDLAVNPVYHEEKSVVAFEFPYHYEGLTFDGPGTYNLQFNTAEECDSTLVLTVQPYDGLRELLISPVPAERMQRVTLFFPFTADEQHDLLVEVYTLGGNLMQTHKPKRFPIELDPFATTGTYMVKITMGTGEVVTGKIIVK